jgi:hypothetical protein
LRLVCKKVACSALWLHIFLPYVDRFVFGKTRAHLLLKAGQSVRVFALAHTAS